MWSPSPQLTRSPADRFLYQSFSLCGGYYYIFGSGTKLYVTEEQMVKPVVNVCPIESNVHQEGKSSLLCLASAMFPPLVQFSWKRQKEDGSLEELLPAEGQFRGSRQSAVIRVVDGDALSRYKYICYVKHEGGTVEAQTQQEVPASPPPPPPPPASTPPVHASTPLLLQKETFPPSDPAATSVPVLHPVKLSVSFQSELRVKLLLLLSTVLIVKSLVYCCGLSLLMILRNKGPSTNCTNAG
ncbi:immunoglobulin lambda-like polypeptide 5 isoform X1 [Melanotaenia boesemani]|uniref:immunoglobulin lambda-like polypeptide 5 isoform X1 n=1 Tax=Melanotaenia boesemani TaxID=1250792 RepID=UPI001C042C5B|nr:immunoglobulin lambda-like polypeptide 5 isoform X1 [Melanotaenia boesemani]